MWEEAIGRGGGLGGTGRYPDNPPDNPKFIAGEMQDFASDVNSCRSINKATCSGFHLIKVL